eukprot:scaffold138705_cov22-Tisochrysis_lutea.AAC.1
MHAWNRTAKITRNAWGQAAGVTPSGCLQYLDSGHIKADWGRDWPAYVWEGTPRNLSRVYPGKEVVPNAGHAVLPWLRHLLTCANILWWKAAKKA